MRKHKRIACAAPAGRVFLQNAPFHQVFDVAQRRILRTFGELRPFRGCQLAFEAVQKLIENLALPVIEGRGPLPFPALSRPHTLSKEEPKNIAKNANHGRTPMKAKVI